MSLSVQFGACRTVAVAVRRQAFRRQVQPAGCREAQKLVPRSARARGPTCALAACCVRALQDLDGASLGERH